jgi:hypothetical protein
VTWSGALLADLALTTPRIAEFRLGRCRSPRKISQMPIGAHAPLAQFWLNCCGGSLRSRLGVVWGYIGIKPELERYRGFESLFLQRRVKCEPDFRLPSRQGPIRSFEFQPGGVGVCLRLAAKKWFE